MLDLTVRRDGMLVVLPACTGRSVQSSGGSGGGGGGGGRWWRWYMVSKDSNGIPWVMMIMIIIMIATKGTIRDLLAAPRTNNNNNNCYSRFFTISSQRRELSPTRTLKWLGHNRVQITCNTSNAYHVRVSCYVPLGTKGQLSYSV